MTEEPYCICAAYDGRGTSCCGFDCPLHPPVFDCGAQTSVCMNEKVAEGTNCIMCDMELGNE